MAKEGVPGGVVPLYGLAIGNALASGGITLDELVTLRSHAKAIVDAQGDLVSAVNALDEEIVKRGGQAAAKGAAPVEVVPSERFTVQITGLPIEPQARQSIEQAVNNAVKAAVAAHDSGGDLKITALSQIQSFGGTHGGATAGLIATIDLQSAP
ncbi:MULTISPECIES: DUF1843 domain-containing protein [unclassified Bradyrhizobium]|uniref:DUF1843 domain-containing protein n=1 Tax=unclassified Bradyrhizobium TaxID=2631580 RepID=UPI0028ECD86B|nr:MULTISPECIES: DUF1843 domain-containing protein [unclassified Bradyrhizobium]